jgi:hypothetical protein
VVKTRTELAERPVSVSWVFDKPDAQTAFRMDEDAKTPGLVIGLPDHLHPEQVLVPGCACVNILHRKANVMHAGWSTSPGLCE